MTRAQNFEQLENAKQLQAHIKKGFKNLSFHVAGRPRGRNVPECGE